ncbi:hypothetical protein BDN72DRAFT_873151 [Pluteus cervinus]|uniref:Uncharacterized protein n=1 Tax=Pluteus cervinus TaxID=181527 RepID=A0ACD2ZZ34_9AGAR|nr:hypothetical protein BDN72DRAFT_873151 [Pluteus cervinus]
MDAHRVDGSKLVIPRDEVDQFKDDVAHRNALSTVKLIPSEPLPAGAEESLCTENWTAANVVREDMVKIFDQTRVFMCVCRHAIVEAVVEMRKSGELAKYGLAVVNKLLQVLGANQMTGYDIGCAFAKTVANSSIGDAAKELSLQFVVDLFHGHAHNRICQLTNLPLYRTGCGIEDFATCKFLYNNYRQALQIIQAYNPEIDALKTTLNMQGDDFIRWNKEELDYLKSRAKAPEYDELKLTYVKALKALLETQNLYDATKNTLSFHAYDTGSGTMSAEEKQRAQKVAAERSRLRNKLLLHEDAVADTEELLGVKSWWTREEPEYQHTLNYIKNKTFFAAMEKLEGLVVQRLFELAKANLSETCYKMRRHISKAITVRSATICTAFAKYNQLAPLQIPPRPTVEFEDVVSYSLLGEFDLLKFSRTHILSKPWTKPTNREVAAKFFKVLQAEEEKTWLNVEVVRLAAWIEHDEQELQDTATKLESSNANVAYQLGRLYSRQCRVNRVHREYIRRIYNLKGFTGTMPTLRDDANATSPQAEDKEDDRADIVGDEMVDEMARLGDCMDTFTQ